MREIFRTDHDDKLFTGELVDKPIVEGEPMESPSVEWARKRREAGISLTSQRPTDD